MTEIADYDDFKYYIEKFYVLPLELKNDIIYCQRAMRDFLKVHTVSGVAIPSRNDGIGGGGMGSVSTD